MYTDEELKTILLDAIASHQSLDHKLHLMEALEKVFGKVEKLEKENERLEEDNYDLRIENGF